MTARRARGGAALRHAAAPSAAMAHRARSCAEAQLRTDYSSAASRRAATPAAAAATPLLQTGSVAAPRPATRRATRAAHRGWRLATTGDAPRSEPQSPPRTPAPLHGWTPLLPKGPRRAARPRCGRPGRRPAARSPPFRLRRPGAAQSQGRRTRAGVTRRLTRGRRGAATAAAAAAEEEEEEERGTGGWRRAAEGLRTRGTRGRRHPRPAVTTEAARAQPPAALKWCRTRRSARRPRRRTPSPPHRRPRAAPPRRSARKMCAATWALSRPSRAQHLDKMFDGARPRMSVTINVC